MTDFSLWIGQELDRRGWSRSEAARRGSISPSAMDKVIGGFANPGIDFCRGVARAFGLPLEEVFRLAGILPPKPSFNLRDRKLVYHVGNNLDERLAVAFSRLAMADQELVITMAERLAGLVEGRIIGEEG
jgi:transcriptional regulator with XRE-family HTH domain